MPRPRLPPIWALRETETVVSRHQDRFIDDTPWSRQTTFYPMRLVEKGATRLLEADALRPGSVRYIEEALSLWRTGRRDRFKIRVPDQDETAFFGLTDDGRITVLELTQAHDDESGSAFAVTVTTYPAGRSEFVMTFGTLPAEP